MCKANQSPMLLLACVVVTSWAQQAIADTVALRSPDGKIAATLLDDNGTLSYSVTFQGHPVIEQSALGLKKDATSLLKIAEVSRSSVDKQWESIWGNQKLNNDRYHEVQLKVSETSQQTIIFRAYNDGIAFRYKIPDTRKFSDKAYAHEATQIKFLSQQPKAWFPLSGVLISNETDLNSWQPAKPEQKVERNHRYDHKPPIIRTPFTVKLSEQAYLSVHEAAVIQSQISDLDLTGNTLTYHSQSSTAHGHVTPWRTVMIATSPSRLIESSMILSLNEPPQQPNTAWVKPGVAMWDWRIHGAHADDGFEYGLNTETYIRLIDFAAETGIKYVLIDAEWYGPERSAQSDPQTAVPGMDIQKICSHAMKHEVGIWLYVNTLALKKFNIDQLFKQYQDWGVVGIKQGFGSSHFGRHIERDIMIAKKCAEHELMIIRHECPKPTGLSRTYPNMMSFEYVNSMLDSGQRPSATPSRVINNILVFGQAGPLDRSCGMFDLDSYISRKKCHRQIPSTVVSQTAQCLLFPTGLLTLPDTPDAYRRKADLFEFIRQLPMDWDDTKVLEAEMGKHITLARRSGKQWFVGALADEQGRQTSVLLDFLEDDITYDVTLYEDAADAHYEYIGPMNKLTARRLRQKLIPQQTRRERYQVKKITAKKRDVVPITIAPGGGHCMWIRPQK